MGKLLHWLCALLLVGALFSLLVLLISDAINNLQPTLLHRQAGAFAFVLIGSSYLSFQISLKRPRNEALKGILLSVAFLLWGFEQLLPPSQWVTLMDSLVVLVFVTDLTLVIIQRLRARRPREGDYL